MAGHGLRRSREATKCCTRNTELRLVRYKEKRLRSATLSAQPIRNSGNDTPASRIHSTPEETAVRNPLGAGPQEGRQCRNCQPDPSTPETTAVRNPVGATLQKGRKCHTVHTCQPDPFYTGNDCGLQPCPRSASRVPTVSHMPAGSNQPQPRLRSPSRMRKVQLLPRP